MRHIAGAVLAAIAFCCAQAGAQAQSTEPKSSLCNVIVHAFDERPVLRVLDSYATAVGATVVRRSGWRQNLKLTIAMPEPDASRSMVVAGVRAESSAPKGQSADRAVVSIMVAFENLISRDRFAQLAMDCLKRVFPAQSVTASSYVLKETTYRGLKRGAFKIDATSVEGLASDRLYRCGVLVGPSANLVARDGYWSGLERISAPDVWSEAARVRWKSGWGLLIRCQSLPK